jgi:hypothetical protein
MTEGGRMRSLPTSLPTKPSTQKSAQESRAPTLRRRRHPSTPRRVFRPTLRLMTQ